MRRKKTDTLATITKKASVLTRRAEKLLGKMALGSGLVAGKRSKVKSRAASARATRKTAKAPARGRGRKKRAR
ncbi:MAG TPA: hypothetical protein VF502_17320 [Stellaceae bacterium]